MFALLLLAACAAPVVSLHPATHSFTPDDYPNVYERWTRKGDPFNFGDLSTVLHATATFESREFRWAYVVRYAADYGLTTDARNAMLAASLSDAEEHHRFFVTLGIGRARDVDLTDKRGPWRVLLLDDRGRQVRPAEIQKVENRSPERTYFPGGTSSSLLDNAPFRTAFRIVFPAKHEDGYPTVPAEAMFAALRFTGPHGHLDLKWEFVHP